MPPLRCMQTILKYLYISTHTCRTWQGSKWRIKVNRRMGGINELVLNIERTKCTRFKTFTISHTSLALNYRWQRDWTSIEAKSRGISVERSDHGKKTGKSIAAIKRCGKIMPNCFLGKTNKQWVQGLVLSVRLLFSDLVQLNRIHSEYATGHSE